MIRLSIAIITLFSFVGCGCVDIYPPKIKTLSVVEPINVIDGAITGDEIKKVMKLRRSEKYYFDAITEYNSKFTEEQD